MMSFFSRFIGRDLVLVLATLSVMAVGQVSAATTNEIHLGSSAALTGPAASLGTRYHAGAKAYFAKLNKEGGIGGAPLVVNLIDDGYEPDQAEANTRKLVDDQRILALFGYVGTPTSNVALPFVRRGKISFVGAYTGADILRKPVSPYVFNVRASYREEAQRMAAAMKAAGVRTLNVLYQYDTFGRAGLEAMRDAATAAGITLLATASVERNTTEVAAGVAELVQKNGADAIFMVSTYATCAAFIQKAREGKFHGRFYTLSFAGLEPLRKALGSNMSGVTVAQIVPNPEDASLPVVAAYQRAMSETGDNQFDSISLEGYIAARVMADGIRHAQLPLTRQSIKDGLEAIGALDLGGFKLRFGPNWRDGSSFVELRSEK